jgi:hypothetical protein
MRRQRLIRFRSHRILLACALILLCGPRGVSAQLPEGRYVRDAAAGDDLEQVVTGALPRVKSTLARIFRGKAKSRLRQVIVAAAWQRFTLTGDTVLLETDAWSGGRGIAVRPGDTLRGWHRYWPSGKTEKLDVVTSRAGNTLVYRYVAEDGQRTDTYTTDSNGAVLVQHIRLESDKLSAPIEYKLIYRKERSQP